MPNEDDIWRAYAKGVKKLPKAKSSALHSHQASSLRKRLTAQAVSELKLAGCIHPASEHLHQELSLPISIGKEAWIPAFAGMTPVVDVLLDRRLERTLRQGEIEIEARIDLHGKTLPEAHAALARFMAAAVKTEKRNLLIITGKGRNNAGAIKTAVPLWLDTLPEAARILALRPAAAKHGGDGAIYLILRRPPAKGRFND